MTQPYTIEISTGRPDEFTRDDDIGVQAEPSVARPEANSINFMNSPGNGQLRLDQSPLIRQRDPTVPHSLIAPVNKERAAVGNEVESERQSVNDPDSQIHGVAPEDIVFRAFGRCSLKELETKKIKNLKKFNKKEGIKLASLNVHGKKDADGKDKYKLLSTLIRKERIAVLAVQESRLDETEAKKLSDSNPKIFIDNNGSSTAKEGVAFIFNKDLVEGIEWETTVIIPNRATRLILKWGDDKGLDIINVYVPNDVGQKVQFLENLIKECTKIKNWTQPIMMGDFNFVEDSLDRSPQHYDDNRVVKIFNKLKKRFNLVDGWRIHNPLSREFTFNQKATSSMSRIDRIYINKDLYPNALDWGLINSAGSSDHDLTYVCIVKRNSHSSEKDSGASVYQ